VTNRTPYTKSFPPLGCFCRVWLRRFLRTESDKFTCVCFGTERLTPLFHSVFVLALGYTGLATLLCHRRLLGIRTRVVILILRHRHTWCWLLLIAHLDAQCDGGVIQMMIDVAAAEVRSQPKTAPAVSVLRRRSRPLSREWV